MVLIHEPTWKVITMRMSDLNVMIESTNFVGGYHYISFSVYKQRNDEIHHHVVQLKTMLSSVVSKVKDSQKLDLALSKCDEFLKEPSRHGYIDAVRFFNYACSYVNLKNNQKEQGTS